MIPEIPQKAARHASGFKPSYELCTDNLLLRPYLREYVPEYHSWLQNDQELLFLTGTEKLSLEEQYANQCSWLTDPGKYTFVFFSKEGEMIGDINLFFSAWIESNQAEINVMIARKDYRGKGLSKEALLAVELFALGLYGRNQIIAKIKEENIASKKLFERMGYALVNHSDHFKEDEYRKQLTIKRQEALQLLIQKYKLKQVKLRSEQYNNGRMIQ